jgi:molybdopterin-guanine dinucleotide biosynthesis protein A
MTQRENVTAIVLAGGRSSRFGRDKLAEMVAGRTMLDRSIDAVRPAAREILVVTALGDARSVPNDVIAVQDSVAFEGPLVGLLTGLTHATQSRVLVAGGDMPTMIGVVLEWMLGKLDDQSVEAVILEHEGRGRPLPAAMRLRPALAAAERLVAGGERRLRALFDELATLVIVEPTWRAFDQAGQSLRDIDTLADLADGGPR